MTTIHVTQDDIRQGVRGSCGRCPVTLAARRATGVLGVETFNDVICIDGSYFPLPPEAVRWVELFDSRFPVSQFSFTLPIDHLVKQKEQAQ